MGKANNSLIVAINPIARCVIGFLYECIFDKCEVNTF